MTSPVSNPSSPYDVNLYIEMLAEESPKKLKRSDATWNLVKHDNVDDLIMDIFRIALDKQEKMYE